MTCSDCNLKIKVWDSSLERPFNLSARPSSCDDLRLPQSVDTNFNFPIDDCINWSYGSPIKILFQVSWLAFQGQFHSRVSLQKRGKERNGNREQRERNGTARAWKPKQYHRNFYCWVHRRRKQNGQHLQFVVWKIKLTHKCFVLCVWVWHTSRIVIFPIYTLK